MQFITTTMARLAQPLAITRNGAIAVAALIFCTWLAVNATTRAPGADKTDKIAEQEKATQGHREGAAYYPTPKQWASLAIAPITDVVFRTEHLTEGKIAVDEDRATLVFSPYSGRVIKLLAKPGDSVKAGQALFVVEAPDMVQAQNDFIAAISGLNKARSALELAKIVEQQNKTLYDSRAGALRDLQTSQATTRAAENDLRSAQTSLEVTRNRLRILGMTDDEIAKFGDTGAVSPHMTIYSPIAGTVIQRKVGPGQYINTSSQNTQRKRSDFRHRRSVHRLAGCLCARNRGAKCACRPGAEFFRAWRSPIAFSPANITYVATSLDASTRRLLVRATLDNKEGVLRPEMFASVKILTGEGDKSLAVPRDAVIYDGKSAHVWVARNDQSVERRDIKTGISNGSMIQVVDGLHEGENVVSKGSLFVDRAAAGS